jgi:hypothetical protein
MNVNTSYFYSHSHCLNSFRAPFLHSIDIFIFNKNFTAITEQSNLKLHSWTINSQTCIRLSQFSINLDHRTK